MPSNSSEHRNSHHDNACAWSPAILGLICRPCANEMSLSAPVQLSLPRYHLFNPLVTQRSLKFAFTGWFAEMNRTRTLGRTSGARCAFSSDHDQFHVNTHNLGIRALAQLVLS